MKKSKAVVSLEHYPTCAHIPHGRALMVWVVDVFNQGINEDSGSDAYENGMNYTCYPDVARAKKDLNKDTLQELAEEAEHKEFRRDFKQWKTWKPRWTSCLGQNGLRNYTLYTPWNDEYITLRAIPLYLER